MGWRREQGAGTIGAGVRRTGGRLLEPLWVRAAERGPMCPAEGSSSEEAGVRHCKKFPCVKEGLHHCL